VVVELTASGHASGTKAVGNEEVSRQDNQEGLAATSSYWVWGRIRCKSFPMCCDQCQGNATLSLLPNCYQTSKRLPESLKQR
jgi:hypothetical protein